MQTKTRCWPVRLHAIFYFRASRAPYLFSPLGPLRVIYICAPNMRNDELGQVLCFN